MISSEFENVMYDIDLRSLEIFRAVAQEGSVTRAAARLNRAAALATSTASRRPAVRPHAE